MRWSYKTVHYEMKKEGLLGGAFLDESEVELSLNEYGKAGWELVSMLETLDGLIAVFKQPISLGRQPSYPFQEETPPEYVSPRYNSDTEELDSQPESRKEDNEAAATETIVVPMKEHKIVTSEPARREEQKAAPTADAIGSIRIE